MYEVYVERHFSSAHRLLEYKGKCEHLHGHNWKVGVLLKSGKLNRSGMLIDFKDLKTITDEVIRKIDHKYLNEIQYFKKRQPTAENIAEYICKLIEMKLKRINYTSIKITVWETPFQYASYEEIKKDI